MPRNEPAGGEAARPLRVGVVDDEPLARDCVRLALAGDAGAEIVAECADGEEAVRAIVECAPDVVLLDVQLPGLDGFGVVERVGAARMPLVVFVSAFDAHALRAFRVHALDYVLKPFDDARLAEAIARVREQLALRDLGALRHRLAALLRDVRPVADGEGAAGEDAAIGEEGGFARRFVVRRGDRVAIVRTEDVDWLEADGNYVRLHVRAETHRLRASLRALVARLDPARFVRIHKSTVVNVDRVREVQPWFGGDYVAILHDGRQLRVSRTFAPAMLRPIQ